jgi:hypothetical protein
MILLVNEDSPVSLLVSNKITPRDNLNQLEQMLLKTRQAGDAWNAA